MEEELLNRDLDKVTSNIFKGELSMRSEGHGIIDGSIPDSTKRLDGRPI